MILDKVRTSIQTAEGRQTSSASSNDEPAPGEKSGIVIGHIPPVPIQSEENLDWLKNIHEDPPLDGRH